MKRATEFKLNNAEYPFHWFAVRDILFRLVYRCISTREQKFEFEHSSLIILL